MNETVIELTMQAVSQLNSKIDYSIKIGQLPFESFILKYPIKLYLTKEQLIEDALKDVDKIRATAKELKKIDEYANSYLNSDINLLVTISKGIWEYTLVDSLNDELFKFSVEEFIKFPRIEVNKFAKDELFFAKTLINLVRNSLHYINKPNEEVIITNRKYKVRGSKRHKNSGKKYIYKKTYIVNYVKEDIEETREYIRHTPNWKVRGHWRSYKSGKKIWIDGHKRGDLDKETIDTSYKITKIED